jgi:DNA-binding NtrC family response regulator
VLDDGWRVPESVCEISKQSRGWRVRPQENLMIGLATARRGRHTILLVDDDPAVGVMFEEHLTEEHFEVIRAPGSMAALKLLDGRRDIDLLLADIALQAGTPHGISLALMARRIVPSIKVVFMTGHPDLLEAAGELPGTALVKPVDLAALTQELRRQLGD